jgi:hypothetical protein
MSQAENTVTTAKGNGGKFARFSAGRIGPEPAGLAGREASAESVSTPTPAAPELVVAAPADQVPMPLTPATNTAVSPPQSQEAQEPDYIREGIGNIQMPFSTRISYQAHQQLEELMEPIKVGGRRGKKRTKTDLLAEALNLLFKKYGLKQVVDE